MTFTIKTIGCKVNTYESCKIRDELIMHGLTYIDVSEEDKYINLDYYIINTCSVTAIADKKSRQMIHKALKSNDKLKVIVTGCSAERIKGTEDLIVVKNDDKLSIPDMIYRECHKKIDSIINKNHLPYKASRRFVKIQDGCDQYCTYCIIPFLRGHIRSRDDNEIVNEIKDFVDSGVREIVLTGIHISSFGLDRVNLNYEADKAIDLARKNILSLMDKIEQIGLPDKFRLRIGSLEPRIINESFLDSLANGKMSKIFCPSFCLSLQSGCDKTLKAMNRHYTKADFENACNMIRKYFPLSTITADVIVGFPGETDEDFNESLEFVKKMRFYNPNIFPYSKREGTKAATYELQNTNLVKHNRAVKMIEECAKKTKEIEDEYNKVNHDILVEEVIEENGIKYGIGYTREYIRGRVVL